MIPMFIHMLLSNIVFDINSFLKKQSVTYTHRYAPIHTYAKTRILTTRRNLYPKIEEQLDMQFKDERDGTTIWKDLINKIKTENPYPPEFDDSEYLAMRAAK